MKVKDYNDLIAKGEELRDAIQSATSDPSYKSSEFCEISGHRLEAIDDFIRTAIYIIENIEIK